MNPISRSAAFVVLVVAFARDLVVSSVQVARAVILPGQPVAPSFVVVPLGRGRSDLEVTLVANYITLTPGTLTVDVSPDRRSLLIHSLLSGEERQSLRDDVAAIERRVTRVTQ
jgi:multicomponent Na+:H+ antiporter subunit E